jgi:uncharacterized membrane protein
MGEGPEALWRPLAVPRGKRFDVFLCYWGALLIPLIFLISRRGDAEGGTRFHAAQGVCLFGAGIVSAVIAASLPSVLAWLPAIVGYGSFIGLFVLGVAGLAGRGLSLPLIGPLAGKWSGWSEDSGRQEE